MRSIELRGTKMLLVSLIFLEPPEGQEGDIDSQRVLLDKKYSAEELCDVERDVYEAFDENFTPAAMGIPVGEHGFTEGTYTVLVVWNPASE